MKLNNILIAASLIYLSACNHNSQKHDASGVFEAAEIIISAEASGKINSLKLIEGDELVKGEYVGHIDTTQLFLKKLQMESSRKGVKVRRPDIKIQIASTKEQIKKTEMEKTRIYNLFKENAATQKQVDDIESQLKVLQSNLDAQLNSLSTSVNSLNEESDAMQIQIAQIEDQLNKCKIINPINGTVLNKYIEEFEFVNPGKPLYKIADLQHMYLRVYVVSSQLDQIKLGQQVSVFINNSENEQKKYNGMIAWISNKAEFTPKTIQTIDERQNLVYAVKISVENIDKMIKIGMYGDVIFEK